MKKNHYRDYAIEAFRLYARLGSSEEYRNRVWNEALARQKQREEFGDVRLSSPTEAAIVYAESQVREVKATLDDLKAVEYTLSILNMEGEGGIVEEVYMLDPYRSFKRGELSERVRWVSLYKQTDVRTIYRSLSKAQLIFAEKRGLRIS